jgi:hypothetical protein
MTKKWGKSVLFYILHLLLGTFVISMIASASVDLLSQLGRMFGLAMSLEQQDWLVGGSPYFPVHLVGAVVNGFFISKYVGHREMLWIWIGPSLLLLYAFTFFPALTVHSTLFSPPTDVSFEYRVSHFFGWACQPLSRCYDRVGITLPFYLSTLYSLGAYMAWLVPQSDQRSLPKGAKSAV